MSLGLLFLFVTSAVGMTTRISISEDVIPHHGKCQKITVPFCSNIPYNETIFPNILNHQKQEEAGMEVHNYSPLIKMKCSPDFQFFMCTVFVPVCTILDRPLPPCRSLCLSAKNGCESIMIRFGHKWPDQLDCNQYPESQEEEMCVGDDKSAGSTTLSPFNKNLNFNNKRKPFKEFHPSRDIGFVCPIQFKVPKNLEYSFKVGNKIEKDCGAPCDMMFFNDDERKFSKIWIGTWSILCSASCLFTVCTFLIDPDRFRYPERPIIFLSACYLMVALAYVIGFSAGDSISCREPFTDFFSKSVSTITQGTKYELCTILFMVLYFFSMASSNWWVVLTLTWFLAAGLKWGHEAIEANSQYFHLAAWAIPAVKTITILAMGKVEGKFIYIKKSI